MAWDTSMSAVAAAAVDEPSTSMTYKALYDEVVRRSGDSEANAKLDLLLGYRGYLRVYPWSFMCPVTTIDVTAADTTTDLPDDFMEFVEYPSYAASSGKGPIVEMVTSKEILDLFASGAATGSPTKFALEPLAFVSLTGQRWTCRWYPTPTADVTLTYCYRVGAEVMSADADYPLGGPAHNMTILYAGLKQWEIRVGHVSGVYHGLYDAELAKSIQFDQRFTAGKILGTLSTTTAKVIHTEIGTVTET